jgi:hypothetical protein
LLLVFRNFFEFKVLEADCPKDSLLEGVNLDLDLGIAIIFSLIYIPKIIKISPRKAKVQPRKAKG